MADRPLVLHPHEVTGLLDGTVTLIARPIPYDISANMDVPRDERDVEAGYPWIEDAYGDKHRVIDLAPLQPGDILVGKETYCIESSWEAADPDYHPPYDDGRPYRWQEDAEGYRWWEQAHYKATDPEPELAYDDVDGPGCKWRSPVTMPAWASRICRPVVSVRAKRVCEMGLGEALAWGIDGEHRIGTAASAEQMAGRLQAMWTNLYGSRYPWTDAWAWLYEIGRTV